jgi:putative transposase
MKRVSGVIKVKYKAWVILPDHIHWLLCPGSADYSDAVSVFKRGVGCEMKRNGLLSKGGKLWQDRFWEETIRDDEHFRNSVEYIHYNPVKHGLVSSPREWGYSSFNSYVRKGIYPEDWAAGSMIAIKGAEYD